MRVRSGGFPSWRAEYAETVRKRSNRRGRSPAQSPPASPWSVTAGRAPRARARSAAARLGVAPEVGERPEDGYSVGRRAAPEADELDVDLAAEDTGELERVALAAAEDAR